jgi:hypothetical protein
VPCPDASAYVPKELGQSFYWFAPSYEPLFAKCYRMTLLVEHSLESHKLRSRVREIYPYSYSIECEEGQVFYCFINTFDIGEEKEAIAKREPSIKVLYSEYLDC